MSESIAESKGKGKAIAEPHDVSMGEEDSSSEEETGAEDEVRTFHHHHYKHPALASNIANTINSQLKEEREPAPHPTQHPSILQLI